MLTDSDAIRTIVDTTRGVALTEGGNPIRRYIGTPQLDQIDPFILLDWFDAEASGMSGFSPHPHRGFETITLMFEGEMDQRDNTGHAGILGPGGMQWMRAGSGVIHGGRPNSRQGRVSGLQFWVNLPAREKMSAPSSFDIAAVDVPRERLPGAEIAVFAGETAAGTTGLVAGKSTEPVLLDVALGAGARFDQPLPAGHLAFVLVVSGALEMDGIDGAPRTLEQGVLARLGDGGFVVATAAAPARFVLAAGKPVGEPMVRGGPFVMSTRAEVLQAFKDYQDGRFGPPFSTSGAAS